jgi:long-chain acyl-CoA synthetase
MADHYDQKPWLKFYDKHVNPTLTYPNKPFPELFSQVCEDVGNQPCLHYMGRAISFKQLDNMSNKLANYLVKNGMKRGDVVAFHLPNLPASYISVVGSQKAGCAVTGVSFLLSPTEIKRQLNDSGAKMLITLDMMISSWKAAVAGTGVKLVIAASVGDYLPPLKAVLGKMLKKLPTVKIEPIDGVTVTSFKEVMDKMPADKVNVKMGMDDIFAIPYTGGTTGVSKGVVMTQRNLIALITQMNTWSGNKKGDVTSSVFPLFHIAGLATAVAVLCAGGIQIAVVNPRDQKLLISSLKKYKPQILGNVPTVYLELMKLPEFWRALDTSRLKYIGSGGAPFPLEQMREFNQKVGGEKIVEAYGLTESGVLSSSPINGIKKHGSVGIPYPDTEVKIVDPNTGEILPFDEPGELICKGPQVCAKGYHNKPEETANAFRNGWFHTGDIARMDNQGYMFIVDRLKEMVNVSGFKVFTRELDEVIMEHPDVFLCASIGIPNPDKPGSEMVATGIVLKPGIEKSDAEKQKIVEYIRAKVAPYKVPKKVELMDELPTSAVGKVLKRELKAKFIAEVNQQKQNK